MLEHRKCLLQKDGREEGGRKERSLFKIEVIHFAFFKMKLNLLIGEESK